MRPGPALGAFANARGKDTVTASAAASPFSGIFADRWGMPAGKSMSTHELGNGRAL